MLQMQLTLTGKSTIVCGALYVELSSSTAGCSPASDGRSQQARHYSCQLFSTKVIFGKLCLGTRKAQLVSMTCRAVQHLVLAQLPAADAAPDGDAGGRAAAEGP